MWDRAAVRAAAHPARRSAAGWASWRLSIGLMVLLATYHGLLAIWSSSSAPGCRPRHRRPRALLDRLPAAAREHWPPACGGGCPDSGASCPPSRLFRREAPRTGSGSCRRCDRRAGARALLERLGYRVSAPPTGASQIWGVKRRWAALGTYLFHGAFASCSRSASCSRCSRVAESASARRGRRGVTSGEPGQVVSQISASATAGSLAPRRGRASGSWTSAPSSGRPAALHRAGLRARTVRVGGAETTRINRPLWLGTGATFLSACLDSATRPATKSETR